MLCLLQVASTTVATLFFKLSDDVQDWERQQIARDPYNVHDVMTRKSRERASQNGRIFDQAYWKERNLNSFSFVRDPYNR